MAIKFSTTAECARTDGIKVLVYGKAGAGKTRLCATAPKPVIIAAEGGMLSLRDEEIPVIRVETMEDLQEAYLWVRDNPKAKKFETICLDSISEIAEIVLSAAKATVKDARSAYGELTDQMTRTLKDFRDLRGKNVYFSAKEAKRVEGETVTFEPGMPGKQLGPAMVYYFDEVFNLNSDTNAEGEKYRYLRTDSNFQYEGKDRSGALAVREEANLTKIFDKITNKAKKK
jgi:hypothetical protein